MREHLVVFLARRCNGVNRRFATVGNGRVTTLWLLLLLVMGLYGCTPEVTLRATRNPDYSGGLEPVTFVIFEGNTGPEYTAPLRKHLYRRLERRRTRARVEIITGTEFNEEETILRLAASSKGMVFIVPAGGTSYYGDLIQILYDVEAIVITDHATGEVLRVWKARLDAKQGDIEDRSELIAHELVQAMQKDGLL